MYDTLEAFCGFWSIFSYLFKRIIYANDIHFCVFILIIFITVQTSSLNFAPYKFQRKIICHIDANKPQENRHENCRRI